MLVVLLLRFNVGVQSLSLPVSFLLRGVSGQVSSNLCSHSVVSSFVFMIFVS